MIDKNKEKVYCSECIYLGKGVIMTKKMFQMTLSEEWLKKIEVFSKEFVDDYRKCNGKFYVHPDYLSESSLDSVVLIERSNDENRYWSVSLSNGYFIDEIKMNPLSENLFKLEDV